MFLENWSILELKSFEHFHVNERVHVIYLESLMFSFSLGVPETLQYSHIINRKRKYGNWGKRKSWKEEKRSKSYSSMFSSTYFTSSGAELNYILLDNEKDNYSHWMF